MTIYEAYMSSPYRSFKHSTYFQVYDRIFSRFVNERITFVEIGILNGGSLFMWRSFLGPQARIIGIDLNPGAARWREEGFEIYIGSQTDPDFWKNFFAEVGSVDVLLDDGCHTFEQQIVTVESALPHINDDGLIVVEDTHTSYMKDFGGPGPRSFISYAKDRVDRVNYRFSELCEGRSAEKEICSIRFYESIVVFEIDRHLSKQVSEPTQNEGETFMAQDFRYVEDSVANTILNFLAYLKSKTNSHLLKKFYKRTLKPLYRLSIKCSTMRKNRSIKRYFRA